MDPDVLTGLAYDEAAWAPVGRPLAAGRARSTAEVQQVVAACAERGVPVVTRGAGTGLSGGANAVDGCLVLDLSRLDQVLEVDVDNRVAVVQPGVVNDDLKAAVAARGLWYPPDPASAPWSTTGGNVATNAGGLCCLKCGGTRDYVLGLEAVVGGAAGPYGTVVRLGRRTTKGVAGYDLAGLFVGSEGTFGVITEVTLRLRPALELVDRVCLQAVEEWKHLGLEADAAALLLAQVDSPGSAGQDEADALVTAFADAGALGAEQSTDAQEAEALFAARRLDGNLHPLILTPVGDEAGRRAAQEAFEAMLSAAIGLGGAVSGEHGIGLLKRGGMQREFASAVLALQLAVKQTLDPLDLFNPGKVTGTPDPA